MYFTATAMIGMIALAGIVYPRTRSFWSTSFNSRCDGGRTMFDAIMESRVVRLRPIS